MSWDSDSLIGKGGKKRKGKNKQTTATTTKKNSWQKTPKQMVYNAIAH